jgi:phage shock protein PspC (stress-responsive transcriptional regulator)
MVFRPSETDDRRMTTEQPSAERRLLRRSTDDRVIGGVAAGLGDYLNIDPLLIRIAFVGLMVFGGLGLILYLAGWILIPEASENDSIGGQLLDRTGLTARRFLLGALIVVGAMLFLAGISDSSVSNPTFAAALGAAIIIIILGGTILRRDEPAELLTDRTAATDAAGGRPAATPRPAPRQRVARVRRPRSPLAGYVVGATLAALGILALVANATSADIQPGQYFGLALGAVGLGLVVGAWWGHARVLILLGLVLAPFAIAASLITVPLQGGFGAHYFDPTTGDELRPEYRLVGGQIWIDLIRLEESSEPIEITATVAMGEIVVRVPRDSQLEVDAAVGGGDVFILDRWQSGMNVADHQVVEGDGQVIRLELEAGVGSVRVETIDPELEEELGL